MNEHQSTGILPDERQRLLELHFSPEVSSWAPIVHALDLPRSLGAGLRDEVLPTGLFYTQGVKANVLFFDNKPAREEPWTGTLCGYDLRTNMHFTQKTNPLRRADLDDLVACYRSEDRHLRTPSWGDQAPDGRWRPFSYAVLQKRDKLNLDLLWVRDRTLEDSEDLPDPAVLAEEFTEGLQTALSQFAAIAEELKGNSPRRRSGIARAAIPETPRGSSPGRWGMPRETAGTASDRPSLYLEVRWADEPTGR